jgi:hypothetical protein
MDGRHPRRLNQWAPRHGRAIRVRAPDSPYAASSGLGAAIWIRKQAPPPGTAT